MNNRQNANSKTEQARLKREFTDPDIFICKDNKPDACYVKGKLMPTRAFGDFYLKHKEFSSAREGFTKDKGYTRIIENFNGPYITHKPEIKIFDISKEDQGFLLSSDGLYDELTRAEVLELLN